MNAEEGQSADLARSGYEVASLMKREGRRVGLCGLRLEARRLGHRLRQWFPILGLVRDAVGSSLELHH